MHVVNLLSSHYSGSFVQALHDQFCEGLSSSGHSFSTIDLYTEKFNPVMRDTDFNQFFGKELPQELVEIHKLLAKTDVLACFYPVWWNDMPAIMKGWIDRVFTKGFAYDYGPEGTWGTLPLKKAVLVCTLGNKQSEEGAVLEKAMRVKEKQGVFGYCGVPEVDHHFLYEVDNKDLRDDYLAKVRALGTDLNLGDA